MRKDPTEFRERFAKWKEGGKPYKDGKISDEQYVSIMENVAADNWLQWGDESEDAALTRILNDNAYDYRGYYNDNPGSAANADTHWPDKYKTVWHPTFSNQSKYSGKKSQYNPYGYPGGTWQGELFNPQWYQQHLGTGFYKDGYPKLPKFEGGEEKFKLKKTPEFVQAGKDNSWSKVTNDDMGEVFQSVVARPNRTGGNTSAGSWKKLWDPKLEKPLESVSPEFFVLSGGLSPLNTGLKAAASKVADKTMLYANSRLYSNNPFVNLYATAARRYNLPDKARLPYLIRAIKSDLVILDEEGNVVLNGNRFGHTNFTYDRKVVPHQKGSWDNSQSTVLVNPREVVPNTKWGSVEPSDMFTVKDPAKGFAVPKEDVIFISGNPTVLNQLAENGIKNMTSPKLRALEEYLLAREAAADAANKTSRFAFSKNERHLANRGYWDEVFNIQSKFGRPKVKDVKLLERVTGMDSGISPIQDLLKFIRLDKTQLQNTPINEVQQLEESLPIFGNGRRFNFMKSSDYDGITYPYKSFFYDPATHAESNFIFQ